MSKALAIKYRPKTFEDLTEQSSIVTILENQIAKNEIKHGYLFCGGAGTGKTTSARIFASMINKDKGTPIELDAASNNSVEDIRRLTDDAQTQSIECEYKVFIIDECHSLSNQAWQAMLKTLEEPPAKSIFIFCTTNPEKIPQTILSRVQRYNFQRISFKGITTRLEDILINENSESFEAISEGKYVYTVEAIDYIAKIADGGMRDAITLMDKCLSFSNELTMENVVKALGVADYKTMAALADSLLNYEPEKIIELVTKVHNSGIDLKLFIKNFFEYILDLNIYRITENLDNTKIPKSDDSLIKNAKHEKIGELLSYVTSLQNDIKWEQNPKAVIIGRLLMFV